MALASLASEARAVLMPMVVAIHAYACPQYLRKLREANIIQLRRP